MRKRSIIAAIFTLCILCLTNNFWLEIKHRNTSPVVKPSSKAVYMDGAEHKPNHRNKKHRNHIKFEFENFVIVLVLSYLLSYKLIDYLADFKTIKDKSRLEILFLTIFFTLLFIPMMHISDAKTSKTENRTLAIWKPLISANGKINYEFGKNFDNWYNDRFFFRNVIVRSYALFKYNIAINYFENKKAYINKKNGWFNHDKTIYRWNMTQKDIDLIVTNINRLKKFCQKYNIKPYIIIVPKKREICRKELYPLIQDTSRYKQTIKIIDYIREKTGVEIVYPYNEISELHTKGLAYYKTDHHWTDEAAYIAYLQVMQQIKKDFPDIKISQPKDFDYKYSKKVKVNPLRGYFNGETYKGMNIKDKKVFDKKYKYYYHKNFDNTKYKLLGSNEKKGYHIFSYFNDIDAPNMILYGDSFTLNLLPILPSSFRNSINIFVPITHKSSMQINNYEDTIIKNKPKVFTITYCGIERLKYIWRVNNAI